MALMRRTIRAAILRSLSTQQVKASRCYFHIGGGLITHDGGNAGVLKSDAQQMRILRIHE